MPARAVDVAGPEFAAIARFAAAGGVGRAQWPAAFAPRTPARDFDAVDAQHVRAADELVAARAVGGVAGRQQMQARPRQAFGHGDRRLHRASCRR